MEFYGWIIGEGFILMCWPGTKAAEQRRNEGAELLSLSGGEFFRFWPGSYAWEEPPVSRNGYDGDNAILFN